jgi:diaminopimelate epimerase
VTGRDFLTISNMTKLIPFVKYHGQGNDWLVVAEKHLPSNLAGFAREFLDRHTGVGGDGLILVMKPQVRGHDARIRFINADGSEAEMSGNGIRCAAVNLLERKPQKRTLELETLAGVKTLEKEKLSEGKWMFHVRMGAPILVAADIPFAPAVQAASLLRFPLKTSRGELRVTVTSMGNPHCSVLVADFESVDWLRLGREIEHNEHFPNRTNVEFVRLVSKGEIEVRFWERGVGHTKSSGTGSCAATVAAILNGLTERRVQVRTEAGPLEVAWPLDGEVILTGPAERVMSGSYLYTPAG